MDASVMIVDSLGPSWSHACDRRDTFQKERAFERFRKPTVMYVEG